MFARWVDSDERFAFRPSASEGAIEIDDALYHSLLAAQATGQVIARDADGLPVAVDQPGPTLAQARAAAIATAATSASDARNRWRTPQKDGVYLSKLSEAQRWLDADSPADLTDFPYIAAETGITAATPAGLVSLWQQLASAWTLASAQIEATEMAAKRDIAAALDAAGIAAVLADLTWPQPPAEAE